MQESNIERKFLQMYENHGDAIFRHCYFRLFDRDQARDLTQETFAKTWSYMVNGGDIKNDKAFLYKVATNLIINFAQRKKDISLDSLQEQGFDPGVDTRESLQNFLAGKEALKQINELDDKYSQAIVMRYVEDLSIKEIAEIIGESENVVSVRLNRGLKKLKEIIET